MFANIFQTVMVADMPPHSYAASLPQPQRGGLGILSTLQRSPFRSASSHRLLRSRTGKAMGRIQRGSAKFTMVRKIRREEFLWLAATCFVLASSIQASDVHRHVSLCSESEALRLGVGRQPQEQDSSSHGASSLISRMKQGGSKMGRKIKNYWMKLWGRERARDSDCDTNYAFEEQLGADEPAVQPPYTPATSPEQDTFPRSLGTPGASATDDFGSQVSGGARSLHHSVKSKTENSSSLSRGRGSPPLLSPRGISVIPGSARVPFCSPPVESVSTRSLELGSCKRKRKHSFSPSPERAESLQTRSRSSNTTPVAMSVKTLERHLPPQLTRKIDTSPRSSSRMEARAKGRTGKPQVTTGGLKKPEKGESTRRDHCLDNHPCFRREVRGSNLLGDQLEPSFRPATNADLDGKVTSIRDLRAHLIVLVARSSERLLRCRRWRYKELPEWEDLLLGRAEVFRLHSEASALERKLSQTKGALCPTCLKKARSLEKAMEGKEDIDESRRFKVEQLYSFSPKGNTAAAVKGLHAGVLRPFRQSSCNSCRNEAQSDFLCGFHRSVHRLRCVFEEERVSIRRTARPCGVRRLLRMAKFLARLRVAQNGGCPDGTWCRLLEEHEHFVTRTLGAFVRNQAECEWLLKRPAILQMLKLLLEVYQFNASDHAAGLVQHSLCSILKECRLCLESAEIEARYWGIALRAEEFLYICDNLERSLGRLRGEALERSAPRSSSCL